MQKLATDCRTRFAAVFESAVLRSVGGGLQAGNAFAMIL
jgi:hypothetical protein